MKKESILSLLGILFFMCLFSCTSEDLIHANHFSSRFSLEIGRLFRCILGMDGDDEFRFKPFCQRGSCH